MSVGFLLAIFGLANMAFRGGERRGYHQLADAPASADGPMMVRRRTHIGVINQVFVWGLALTLVAATVVLMVATFVFDSWTWP